MKQDWWEITHYDLVRQNHNASRLYRDFSSVAEDKDTPVLVSMAAREVLVVLENGHSGPRGYFDHDLEDQLSGAIDSTKTLASVTKYYHPFLTGYAFGQHSGWIGAVCKS